MTPSAPFPAPFALGTFSGADRNPFPGLVVADRIVDLRRALEHAPGSTLSVLQSWDQTVPELHRLAEDPGADSRPLDGMTVHPPLQPRQLLQSGANYRQHVIDLDLAHRSPDDTRPLEQARAEVAEMMDRRAAENLPYVFVGLPSSITGPYDDVVLPSWCEKPDWELELAVVISKSAYRIEPADVPSYIAGYTIANDITDRASVFRADMPAIGTDWLRSKNAPGFTPLGPYLVPAEFVAAPADLRITLKLNGETKQDESTSDMLFGVSRLISYISRSTQLLAGDVVLTGSPAGNGMHWGRMLRDGDVMQGSITGLGTQRTRCAGEEKQ